MIFITSSERISLSVNESEPSSSRKHGDECLKKEKCEGKSILFLVFLQVECVAGVV